MTRTPARTRLVVALALVASLVAVPATALRVVTWNLLGYTESVANARRSATLTVLPALAPDVIIVQELLTAAAADSFATFLRTSLPGRRWIGGASTFLLATQSALYYDSLQVTHSNLSAVATGGPRQVLVALVRPNGYRANAASFRLYSMHFKAGNGATTPSDSSTRTLECTNLRNTLNLAPAGTNLLLGGDSNFYGAFETGYTRLTESQADNDGRLKDPLNMPGTWNSSAYSIHLTQSPCSGAGCVGSNGGLDDRFDLFLGSYPLFDGVGLDLVPGALPNGYGAFGNDGLHYNDSIDGSGVNLAVPFPVATALRLASDHLPVVATLQLPAKLSTASALAFGDVIVGATSTTTLTVDNLPAPPAATLSYSFTAPAGFSAPTGSFTNAATAAPGAHAIGMTTTTAGVRSGTLTVSSNDLDTTAKAVQLSGRVLAHAVPSLDSLATVTSGALAFGTVAQGSVTTLDLRAHNRGTSALQARLAHGPAFVAGDARFAVSAPASPIATAGTWTVSFDATAGGVGPASAELRIPVADEPLPGAIALDTLRISLTADVAANGGVEPPPTALRFAPPAPNPLRGVTRFAFDLPSEAPVSLAVYDASGRRVAELASGRWPAGRHQVDWDVRRMQGGRPAAGLYFARFETPGLSRVARLVLLP